jgi:hypothetical protein
MDKAQAKDAKNDAAMDIDFIVKVFVRLCEICDFLREVCMSKR